MSQRNSKADDNHNLPPQYVPRSQLLHLSYAEKYDRQRVKYDYQMERRAGLLQTMKYAQFKMEKLGHENDLLLDAIMGYQIGPPMHPADVAPPDQVAATLAKETHAESHPTPPRRERERERREPRERERGREREREAREPSREVREHSREAVRDHSREIREQPRDVSREPQEQPVYRVVENGASAEANGHAAKRQRVG